MSTILPTDANIVYSPYNWLVSGGVAKTNNAGAYLRMSFTGDANTLTATFDMTNMTGLPEMSRVGFRIDGGPWQDFACAASISPAVPTDNTWGRHVVEMVVISTYGDQRWTSGQRTAVIFTGLTADVAVSTVAIRKKSLNAFCIGSSTVEGIRTISSSVSDVRYSWSYQLGEMVGAEVGISGYGGMGLIVGGGGQVPAYPETATKLWEGQARALTPAPDLIVAQVGAANDASSDATLVTAAAKDLCNYWIANTPSTTKIYLLGGWQPNAFTAIQAGIAASTNPARIQFIDTTGWANSANTSDAIHQYGYSSVTDLAPRVAATVRTALPGSTRSYYKDSSGNAVPLTGGS